jgi:hypothetical protein
MCNQNTNYILAELRQVVGQAHRNIGGHIEFKYFYVFYCSLCFPVRPLADMWFKFYNSKLSYVLDTHTPKLNTNHTANSSRAVCSMAMPAVFIPGTGQCP